MKNYKRKQFEISDLDGVTVKALHCKDLIRKRAERVMLSNLKVKLNSKRHKLARITNSLSTCSLLC